MVVAYCSPPEERIIEVLLEALLQKSTGEVNLLTDDTQGRVMSMKYLTQDLDRDDLGLTILDSSKGILSNSSTPYPFAMDGRHGLSLLNPINIGPGDTEWGHMHLLHMMENRQEWLDTLKNRYTNRFDAIYLEEGKLSVWCGNGNLYLSLIDGSYLISNSKNLLRSIPTTVYALEKTSLYIIENNSLKELDFGQ